MPEEIAARLRAQATFVPDSRPGDVMLEAAEAIDAVLAIHRPEPRYGSYFCASCLGYSSPMPNRIPWPCRTARALGVEASGSTGGDRG